MRAAVEKTVMAARLRQFAEEHFRERGRGAPGAT
jgi:hypothetical protein